MREGGTFLGSARRWVVNGSITRIKGDIALLKARLEKLRAGREWDLGFSFPIRKINEEKWEVEGIAASEVLDQQGEIIEYPALKKAFGSFLGNVREMHQAVAVGKAVSITCDDANKCVLVRAMISKGAPLTWEKVKDKTLSGFSIGGQRLRSQLLENGIRKTTELRLTELSLVDAPANPQAFFSLVKFSEGVPTATELLATDGEEPMSSAAVSLERVSRVLAAGAFENFVSILKSGRVRGSMGFIQGGHRAACLMDVPFVSLKYVFKKGRYEPYGVFLTKKAAYERGCRPVLYLSNKEKKSLGIPKKEWWRVVRLHASKEGWISWLHEREWRCKGDLKLPSNPYGVLVRNADQAEKLREMIEKSPHKFKVRPRSIIPLTVICQGLP